MGADAFFESVIDGAQVDDLLHVAPAAFDFDELLARTGMPWSVRCGRRHVGALAVRNREMGGVAEQGHLGHPVTPVTDRRALRGRGTGAASPSMISAVSFGAYPSNSCAIRAVAATGSVKSIPANQSPIFVSTMEVCTRTTIRRACGSTPTAPQRCARGR